MRKITVYIVFAVLFFIAACGSSIHDAQDFIPNEPPAIVDGSLKLTTVSGDDIGESVKKNLMNGMTFKVWIKATDPEGKPLSYKYTSPNATFAENVTETDGSVSSVFVTKDITVLITDVSITAVVTDEKKSTAQKAISLGSGKAGPSLTTDMSVTKSFIMPTASTSFSFYSDSDGYYQVRNMDGVTDPSLVDVDYETAIYKYAASTTGTPNAITIQIAGATAPDPGGKIVRVSAPDGAKNVWVLFWDGLEQFSKKDVVVTSDGTAPSVVFKSNGTTVADGARVSSEEVITAEGSDANSIGSITLDGASTALRTDKYTSSFASSVLTVTPTDNFSLGSKTVTVTATDAAGNTRAETRTLNIYALDFYVSTTGSDSNEGFKDEPLLTIQKGIDAVSMHILSGEMGYVRVMSGDYPEYKSSGNARNGAIDIVSFTDKSITLLGGYDDDTFSETARNGYSQLQSYVAPYVGLQLSSSTPVNINSSHSVKIDKFSIRASASGANGYSACILSNTSNIIISNCLIKGIINSTYSNRCAGIIIYRSTADIINNNISAQCSGSTLDSQGIYIQGARSADKIRIINNTIHGTDTTLGGNIAGISIFTTTGDNNLDVIIRNNTIVSGYNSQAGYYPHGIRVANGLYTITTINMCVDNNILYNVTYTAGAYSIYQATAGVSWQSISGNLMRIFYDTTNYYVFYNNGTNLTYTNLTSICSTATGNARLPTVAFTTPVNNYFYITDFTSPSTSTFIGSSGINGNDSSWSDFPRNSGGDYCDINDYSRPITGGWSIGAYQDLWM